MKRIITLLVACVVLSALAFCAAEDGRWNYAGTDATAPRVLVLQQSGTALAGTMDNIVISNAGTSGPYFWFTVGRNSIVYTYKGQVKGGNVVLNEASSQGNRTLTFAPAAQ